MRCSPPQFGKVRGNPLRSSVNPVTTRPICTGTGLIPPTFVPGLGSPRPHLHRDWARPTHICTGTGIAPPKSAPGLGSPLLHLHRDRASERSACSRSSSSSSSSTRTSASTSSPCWSAALRPTTIRPAHRSGPAAAPRVLCHSLRRSGMRATTGAHHARKRRGVLRRGTARLRGSSWQVLILLAYPHIECWTAEHNTLIIPAAIGVALWSAPAPPRCHRACCAAATCQHSCNKVARCGGLTAPGNALPHGQGGGDPGLHVPSRIRVHQHAQRRRNRACGEGRVAQTPFCHPQ
jgi:hypothetical protein